MPIFLWKGTDRNGKAQKGEVEADNVTLARQLVIRKGINVKSVKAKPKDISEYLPFLKRGVGERDLVIFVRQFSTMIDAGMPVVQCLEILQDQQDNQTFKAGDPPGEDGRRVGCDAFRSAQKHPKVFDNLFVNLVSAGEMGGILDVILGRLAAYIEKTAKLKKRVKGAMTYPGIVITIAVVVVAVILVYVIPVFAGLFKDAGVALPRRDDVCMNLSYFAQSYVHWIVIGLGLLAFGFKKFRDSPKGRDLTDRLFLKAPVFGTLLRKGGLWPGSREPSGRCSRVVCLSSRGSTL